ncbi:hypothetical protein KFJ24_04540 [Marinobacter sediminum]|uniref:outer membrane protein assembly factor BamE n=1 Tax=Marinobacter sediminum TaxID=256323 RepID=UPI00202FFB08|nr:outer membrane protein assembly factor BamE [Marinobacter sediminum]MCM0611743.1 hypothetical protein [Marinobacter sediminum]
MRKNKALFGALTLAATLTMAPVSGAIAEELRIPVGTQADRYQGSFPKTGMTQDSVRSSWGQPAEIRGPVGEPPITQWYYQDFVVYFENNRVLHTVLKRRQ